MALTNCVGVGDAAVVALSRYRRAPAADLGPGPAAGPPGGHDAGGLDGGSAAALNAGLDGLSLGMPQHATLARSAVEGGFEKARAAHVPAVPAAAAAASSGGGGLEDVDIAGCGACTDLRDSSVQVREGCCRVKTRLPNIGSGPQRCAAHMALVQCIFQHPLTFWDARQATCPLVKTSSNRAPRKLIQERLPGFRMISM